LVLANPWPNLSSDGTMIQDRVDAAEVPDNQGLEENLGAWYFLANFSEDLDDTTDFELG